MKPEISIVIPAFNESTRIVEPLDTILSFAASSKRTYEVIVVDDGSTDDTSSVVERAFAAHPEISASLVRYDENRGKGFAVRTGFLASNADIAVFTDADLSTPITEVDKLVPPIEAGSYQVTFGSRAIDRSLIGTHQPWRREQGGKVMNQIIRRMSKLDFYDTQCGFKAFDLTRFRPLLELMRIDRFGFDVEFLFVAQHHGLKLKEIPVRWNDVAGSKVSIFRDTLRMIDELRQVRQNARSGAYDRKKGEDQ